MKTLLSILSLAALAGCAYQPVGPEPVYGARMAPPADPSQWHVVSVTPVAPGTGARLAATSGQDPFVQYSSEPLSTSAPLYVARPVYYPQPVYLPQPLYAPAPRYYSPVSIGLDFGFGRSWGGHRRNWAGVGIGTRWPR
jgi:hypothetical protein